MLIKSIELTNFRQFKRELITFSTDTKKNVTILIGDNTGGKTTLAQAFSWCLYGKTSFTDKSMLNKEVESELSINSNSEVKVAIVLKHLETEYVIIRKQKYIRSSSSKVKSVTPSVVVRYIENGVTKFLSDSQIEGRIREIMPIQLSKYFFFDGERLEKMSKEIQSGNKSDEFKDAVNGLLGLNTYLEAIRILNPRSKSCIIGYYDSKIDSKSNSKIHNYTVRYNEEKLKIQKLEKRLEEIEDEIVVANHQINDFRDKLRENADSARTQKNIDGLKNDILKLNKSIDFSKEKLYTSFHDNYYSFFANPVLNSIQEMLKDYKVVKDDVPDIHSKTINQILKKGRCLCGTKIELGTKEYDNLYKLLDYLPPHSIGIAVKYFKTNMNRIINNNKQLDDLTEDNLRYIREITDEISSKQNEQMELEKGFYDPNISKKVQGYKNNMLRTETFLKQLNKEKDSKNIALGEARTKLNRIETERAALTLTDEKNRKLEYYKAYATEVLKGLNFSFKLQENKVRTELEKKINEIYQTIFNDDISLVIDEGYRISVHLQGSSSYSGKLETSTAQSIAIIFSFILGVIHIARNEKNREKDYEILLSEAYPFVLDAPLSSFDKTRIKAVCKQIPDIAEQVIIMIKDTDGEIADNYMSDRIGSRYNIRKNSDIESVVEVV